MAIDTSTSPESVRRRQRIADQLLADNMGQQNIQSWTQGAAQLANVLAGGLINRRAEREAAEGREAGNALLARLLGGGGSAGGDVAATTMPFMPQDQPTLQMAGGAPPQQQMSPQDRINQAWQPFDGQRAQQRINGAFEQFPNAQRDFVPTAPPPAPAQQPGRVYDPTQREAQIRDGLVQRGLPQHVADGFVRNFQDESGLDPSINERQPLVPGSRGGYGLAQWTGPRRVALEQFAAGRGADVSDPNVQLDFLVSELQGPEARAFNAISQTTDSNSAAQAIATNFLRPSPENLQRRVAEYGGGQRAPLDQMAQAGGGIPAGAQGRPDLSALLSDPAAQWIDPQIRSALIAQGLKDRQAVSGVNINGRLVNPQTGQLIADYSDPSTAKAPSTQTVENPDGTKTTLQYVNGQWTPLTAPGASGAGARPNPKLTEQQSKDVGFYNRGAGSLPLIDQYESALLDVGDAALGSIPGAGNLLTSENYKLGQQAGREFLQAILRKDTGAAITKEETSEYGSVFLPMPGDTPQVLAQKRQSRARALDGIRSGLGPAEVLAVARPDLSVRPPASGSAGSQRRTGGGVQWEIIP